jgi:hypothetical protein
MPEKCPRAVSISLETIFNFALCTVIFENLRIYDHTVIEKSLNHRIRFFKQLF